MFSLNASYAIEIVPKQKKVRNIHKFITAKPDNGSIEKGTSLSPVILTTAGETNLNKIPRNWTHNCI